MSASPRLAAFAATALFLAPISTSEALTPVSEDFSGPALDPAVWLVSNVENARLFQRSSKLHFTILPSPSGNEDYAQAEIVNNYPLTSEDWEVLVDVRNERGRTQETAPGIWISNFDNIGHVLYFEFYGTPAGNNGGYVVSFHKASGGYLKPHLYKNFGRRSQRKNTGSMRVTFRSANQLFTFWCKAGGRGRWAKVGTFSITGAGGDRALNWQMDRSNGRFLVALGGFGEDARVPVGHTNFDNFHLRLLK